MYTQAAQRTGSIVLWLLLSASTSVGQLSHGIADSVAVDSLPNFNAIASKIIDSLHLPSSDIDRFQPDAAVLGEVLPDSISAQAFDALRITLRRFDLEALSQLRAQKEFQYDRPPPPPPVWQRIRDWLDQNILRHIFSDEVTEWIEHALTVISVLVLIYLVLKLIRTDLRSLFYGSKTLRSVAFQAEEHLEPDALQALIEQAMADKDYRRAVRYLFLRVLKLLAAKDLIAWRIDKTNRDYLYELKQPELRTPFAELARFFEYVWYGGFWLTEQEFAAAKRAFDAFTTQLQER
ncbi:MAG: DUF4129 domain-containing protein [Chloroherpetonaceae bacterium]|nr:DUF4129 domain-containing protein [Chloroherpetonaceae bacterium]